jgi:primosomal protein N'
MSDFVTLTCPSCGGKLEITNDIDRFACAHCGAEHVVRRGGGLVSLAPVVNEIRRVGVGVDKTASELAIRRLTNELAELENNKKKDKV